LLLGIVHNINPATDDEVHEVVWIPDASGEVFEQHAVIGTARRLQESVRRDVLLSLETF
jgi:hypothetical protein